MHYIFPGTLYFPPPEDADENGILAVGGDLSTDRLMLAYRSGIFPWFDDDEPILWWSPPQRMVVIPATFKAPKSMRNILNRNIFSFTFNQNFRDVIKNCQTNKRKGQKGTWITDGMLEAYCRLNELGFAKSVEVWKDNELVGGLYGVDLGSVFCGESMFSNVSNASKAAFCFLVDKLKKGDYRLLDCQVHNTHLETLGAFEIPRFEFLTILRSSL
jgi:leucyl/phenylalanyl-tRNA--protein transferase